MERECELVCSIGRPRGSFYSPPRWGSGRGPRRGVERGGRGRGGDDGRRAVGVAAGWSWTTGFSAVDKNGWGWALVRGEVSRPQRRDDDHLVDGVAGGASRSEEAEAGRRDSRPVDRIDGHGGAVPATGEGRVPAAVLCARRVVTRPTAPRGGGCDAWLERGSRGGEEAGGARGEQGEADRRRPQSGGAVGFGHGRGGHATGHAMTGMVTPYAPYGTKMGK